MSTKRPVTGRFDQSALAVTWNSGVVRIVTGTGGSAGAAVTAGGAGGAGGNSSVAGTAGSNPGGGGGGDGADATTGPAGGNGWIRITYTEGATGNRRRRVIMGAR